MGTNSLGHRTKRLMCGCWGGGGGLGRLELAAMADILEAIGMAPSLRVNQSKSAAFAIRCSDDQKILVGQSLGFSFSHFPCKYLGLPLTIRKQSRPRLSCSTWLTS